jgi:hypothetical protein
LVGSAGRATRRGSPQRRGERRTAFSKNGRIAALGTTRNAIATATTIPGERTKGRDRDPHPFRALRRIDDA